MAAKACPRVGEVHDLPHILPLVTPCTVAVDEVDAVFPGHDADRACRLAAVGVTGGANSSRISAGRSYQPACVAAPVDPAGHYF